MPDSQMVDRMSDSVLTKLLEVESELATQEAGLLAQIEAIRQKRASLSAVVNMFATSEAAAPPESPTPAAKRGRKPAQAKTQETNNSVPASLIDNLIEIATGIPEVAPEAAATNGTAPEPPAPEPKAKRGRRAAQPSQAKEKPAASTSKPKSAARGPKAKQTSKEVSKETEPKQSTTASKPKSTSKEGRKSNNWRNYMRPEFGKAPLPEVVSSVLQRQSNGIFDVPTIVSTIFVQDTPKEVRNQARDRVLHILSAGVKEKKWYRGKTGQYSLSQSVAESTIDS